MRRFGRRCRPRAQSESEAIALQQRFGTAVAIKAEVPGLLHKSDIGCVRLGLRQRARRDGGLQGRDPERAPGGLQDCGACAGPADGDRRCGSLCGHHRRSAVRPGDLLRPRRHLRRNIQRCDDRDGAAVARRRSADDPAHQGRLACSPARAAASRATSKRWPTCSSGSASSPSPMPAGFARSISIPSSSRQRAKASSPSTSRSNQSRRCTECCGARRLII